ncbi:MAG: hypothetical protein NTX00_03025, partial [Candidatus Parcubacteria bacterium]|nr:hypothetical protein [Candidatus Parcubacteria bacterium]
MPSVAEKARGVERPQEAKKARKFEVVDTPKKLEQMRQRALASLTEAAQEAVNERNVRLVSSVEAVGGTEQDKMEGKRRLRLVQNEEEELTSKAQKEIESEEAVPLATYEEQLGEISEIAAKEKLEKQVAEAWEWYLAEPGKIEEKKSEEIVPEKEAAKPEEILAGPDYNRLAAKLGFSDAEKLSEEDAKAFVEAKLKRRREFKEQEAPMAGRGYSGGEILTEDEAEKLEEQFKNIKFESEFKNNLENLQLSREAFANLDRFKKKKNTPEWQAAQKKYLQNMHRRQNLLLELKKSELEELKKDSKEEWEKLGFGKDLGFDDLKLSKKELLAKYGKEYPKQIKKLENGIKEMKRMGFSGEFDYDKELLKQSEEIVQATMIEESIKLTDLKTKLRLEEQGKTKFEKLKDYAFSAVDKYRKLPLKTKLMYSGILLGVGVGAGAVGGATGAAMLTGVVAGRWFQKAFGAGASFLGFEAILKRAQEKEKQKKAREVAKNLESYLSNN